MAGVQTHCHHLQTALHVIQKKHSSFSFTTRRIWIRHVVSSHPFASQPTTSLPSLHSILTNHPIRSTHRDETHSRHNGGMKKSNLDSQPSAIKTQRIYLWDPLVRILQTKRQMHLARLAAPQLEAACRSWKGKEKAAPNVKAHAHNTKTVLHQICQIRHVKSETIRITHGCFAWFDPVPLALRDYLQKKRSLLPQPNVRKSS